MFQHGTIFWCLEWNFSQTAGFNGGSNWRSQTADAHSSSLWNVELYDISCKSLALKAFYEINDFEYKNWLQMTFYGRLSSAYLLHYAVLRWNFKLVVDLWKFWWSEVVMQTGATQKIFQIFVEELF